MDNSNNLTPTPENGGKKGTSAKSRVLWTLLFVVIAALSVWMVTSQSQTFSIDEFKAFLASASVSYIIAAIVCMLGFIVFEAAALKCLDGAFGYRHSLGKGIVYSATDIYFSAITPSATGGQPVCGMFMMRDGIPGAVTTASLLINLAMYSFSILLIGIFSITFHFNVFSDYFGTVSKLLIVFGLLIQVILTLFIVLLIFREKLLHRICSRVLGFLGKIRLIRKPEKKLKKLDRSMAEYRACIEMIKKSGARGPLIRAFIFNLLQRISQVSVTMFTFLAASGSPSLADEVWSMQNFVVIGSYCAPIPGAMGVADWLLLDGFGEIMSAAAATNLEILSRAASFYLCTMLCGIIVLVKFLLRGTRRRVK